MSDVFSANLLLAIVTLIVGGITLFIYYKEKNGRKRDVAKLILQEIRYAENKIKEYRLHKQYKLAFILLPTNSWNDNIHLFIKNFEQSETDLISVFYSQVEYIDYVVKKIGNDKLIQHPTISPIQMPSIPLVVNPSQPIPVQSFPFTPGANMILEEVSISMELIYNTPAIAKLKTLSERRWYQV
ncbi:MAG: hypothetical protein AAB448_03885 [Patescibacteria group bacterium]